MKNNLEMAMSKRYWCFGHKLPSLLANPLFGDRKRFGLKILENDSDWREWLGFSFRFYHDTQKNGLGKIINDAGYKILSQIDLNGKRILEVGPGTIPHRRFWNGKPDSYIVVDIRQEFLDQSLQILKYEGVASTSCLSSADSLPLQDGSIDIILSFYSLEHMYPIDNFMREFRRILRSGGLLVGAIPSEGGLAWGLGRFLTSRRYIKKNSGINPDKIICWEHPNFADHILESLMENFEPVKIEFWPFKFPLVDFNLISSFIYRNGKIYE